MGHLIMQNAKNGGPGSSKKRIGSRGEDKVHSTNFLTMFILPVESISVQTSRIQNSNNSLKFLSLSHNNHTNVYHIIVLNSWPSSE